MPKSRLPATVGALVLLALPLAMPAAEKKPSGKPGTLAWQSRFGGAHDPTAHAVALGTSVFVAGRAPAPRSGDASGWLVRAYGVRKGDLLWQDALPGAEWKAGSIAALGTTVFAGGYGDNQSATADDALVRAYDAKTGKLRWESRFSLGGTFAGIDALAADKDLVVGVGRAQRTSSFATNDWFVRALDAKTGAVRWQAVTDDGPFDDAGCVAVTAGRVFVGGVTTDGTSSMRRFTVRAYSEATGALLWQERLPSGNQNDPEADVAQSIAAQGGEVVAAGSVTDADGFHFAVRAYDGASGTVRWSEALDSGGDVDIARAVAVQGGRVFAAGIGGATCVFGTPSNCNWLLRAYGASDGSLLWAHEVDREGGDADQPNAVLVSGNRLAVAGGAGTSPTAPEADWLVQVYGATDGKLAWENLLHTPGTYAYPVGLAVSSGRLIVSGSTVDLTHGTQNGDWIVRAYELGGS